MPKVFIIILNWNQYDDTKECLESLDKLEYQNYDIVIVDNGSKDDSFEKLKKEFPRHAFIKNKENLGFACGNNIGIEFAMENKADYILLLNNDTKATPDFLSSLIEQSKNNNIGIASPKIMFYSAPYKIWFVGGGFLSVIKKPFHKFYGQNDFFCQSDAILADWVSGCCMLIKREVIEKIGMLDGDYFNNYEDVDFCVRAKKSGFNIAVIPQAKIYHKFAASMGGKFSPLYTYFRVRNNLLFFRKTYQYFYLILNFFIFPFYSILESFRRFDLVGIKATFFAVFDFLCGRYGYGSAGVFVKKGNKD